VGEGEVSVGDILRILVQLCKSKMERLKTGLKNRSSTRKDLNRLQPTASPGRRRNRGKKRKKGARRMKTPEGEGWGKRTRQPVPTANKKTVGSGVRASKGGGMPLFFLGSGAATSGYQRPSP